MSKKKPMHTQSAGKVSHPLVKKLQEARLATNEELKLTEADMRELALCLIWGNTYTKSKAFKGCVYLPLEAIAWAESQQQEGGWNGVGNGELILAVATHISGE